MVRVSCANQSQRSPHNMAAGLTSEQVTSINAIINTAMDGTHSRLSALIGQATAREESLNTATLNVDRKTEYLNERLAQVDLKAEDLNTRMAEVNTKAEYLNTKTNQSDAAVTAVQGALQTVDAKLDQINGLMARIERETTEKVQSVGTIFEQQKSDQQAETAQVKTKITELHKENVDNIETILEDLRTFATTTRRDIAALKSGSAS